MRRHDSGPAFEGRGVVPGRHTPGELGPRKLKGALHRRLLAVGPMPVIPAEGARAAHGAFPGEDAEHGKQLQLRPSSAVQAAKVV